MRHALINVPGAPYLKANRGTPPIATGLVTSLTAVEAGPATAKILRTRSQFIMAEIWQNQDDYDDANFMHHARPPLRQNQNRPDVDY